MPGLGSNENLRYYAGQDSCINTQSSTLQTPIHDIAQGSFFFLIN